MIWIGLGVMCFAIIFIIGMEITTGWLRADLKSLKKESSFLTALNYPISEENLPRVEPRHKRIVDNTLDRAFSEGYLYKMYLNRHPEAGGPIPKISENHDQIKACIEIYVIELIEEYKNSNDEEHQRLVSILESTLENNQNPVP